MGTGVVREGTEARPICATVPSAQYEFDLGLYGDSAGFGGRVSLRFAQVHQRQAALRQHQLPQLLRLFPSLFVSELEGARNQEHSTARTVTPHRRRTTQQGFCLESLLGKAGLLLKLCCMLQGVLFFLR